MSPFSHQTGMSRKESDHCRALTQHNDEEAPCTKTQLTKRNVNFFPHTLRTEQLIQNNLYNSLGAISIPKTPNLELVFGTVPLS